MLMIRIALAALLLSSMQQQLLPVAAFPSGTGGCAGNRAAVEGPHLTASARTTGPLGNARLEMVLDDEFVLSGATSLDFTTGVNHTLTLRTIDAEGRPFRGFLFRLGPPGSDEDDETIIDTTEALDTDGTMMDTSVALEHCITGQGVGGVTHTNSNLKETVSGVLRMDEVASNLPLDVTVVIQNRNGLSEFYYQQFTLNAVTGDSGPGGPAPVPQAPTLPPLPPAVLGEQIIPPSVAPTIPPSVLGGGDSDGTSAPLATMVPTVAAPAPATTQAPTGFGGPPVVDRKVAEEAKCGSLAADNGRGGSAAQSKDCSRISGGGGGTRTRRRKLKGSSL